MKKSALGFTLVELLVVVTIMAITGVFAFANFANFGEDQKLKSATADIQSLIRQAQANASSNTKCQDDFSAKWQVVFSADRKTVTLGCEESGTFYSKKILALDKVDQNLQIESISRAGTACPADPGLPYTINFELLKGTMNLGEPQCTSFIVSLQNATNSKSLSMTTGGVLQTRPSCDADGSQLNELVGYWDFDEGSGTTVADKSGYNRHGTWSSNVATNWTANGKIGKAGQFNGSNYVSLGRNILGSMSGAFTVSAWIKDYNTGGQAIISEYESGQCGDALFYINGASAQVVFHDGNSSYNVFSGNVTDDRWHFVAYTYDGSLGKIYVDGVGGANTTGTTWRNACSPPGYPNTDVRIGSATTNYFFNGLIDEVRIYNRALTYGEISNAFNRNTGCSLF